MIYLFLFTNDIFRTKTDIPRYDQFLLFPQGFLKACFPGASKGVIVWEWVIKHMQKTKKLCPKNLTTPLKRWKTFSPSQTVFRRLPLATLIKKPFKNMVGKGENAGNLHFLPFPPCSLTFPI